MLTILAAGSVFFPGLFLLSKQCLKSIPALRWSEGDAVIVSARLVSSVQAVMASSAGYIIASSCKDIIEDQHWLTSTYIMFAVPYFVYDIYAMFMCYWYKLRVKGHEEASAAPQHMSSALTSYLRREFLMVLHHVVMVTVCFPVSVFWRQGKGDYFQGIMFMAELSTPSVCLGKILIQYKQQHTLLHKVNGALMLITFFHLSSPPLPLPLLRLWKVCLSFHLCFLMFCCLAELGSVTCSHMISILRVMGTRIQSCMSPLFVSRYASIPFHMVPFSVPWHCNLGAALLMAPQLYWFSLICRGALRLFTGSSRSQRPRPATAAPKERQTDGSALPQPANGYSTRSTEPELATH